jgi:hypothetical protein
MAFTLEDGTGISDANAYVSLDFCITYCTDRGLTFSTSPSSLGEEAIVRATAALDAMYRFRFNGYKTHGRNQALEWPRTAAYDREGYLISGALIPIEIQNAVSEMAVREYASPGSMLPDLERGGAVQMLRAGSVEVQYAANAAMATTFQLIDGMLTGLLLSSSSTIAGVGLRG